MIFFIGQIEIGERLFQFRQRLGCKIVEIRRLGDNGALTYLNGLVAEGAAQRRKGPVVVKLGLMPVVLDLVPAADVPLKFSDNRVVGVAQRGAVVGDKGIIVADQALIKGTGAAQCSDIEGRPHVP